MTAQAFVTIALGIAFANLMRAYHSKYRIWKSSRAEIPAARNWRGVFEPDLHLKRIERGLVWGWIAFTTSAFIWLANPFSWAWE